MNKRQDISKDFYNKLLDHEENPIYCSDEASFYTIYVGKPKDSKK